MKGVGIGRRAEAASEESAESQISIAEAEGIAGKPETVRRGLIVERVPGIERQAEIGIAKAGEQRLCIGLDTGVGARVQHGIAIKMAGIAVAFALEQSATGNVGRRRRGQALREAIDFRGERADIVRALEERDRLPPVVINVVRIGTVYRA